VGPNSCEDPPKDNVAIKVFTDDYFEVLKLSFPKKFQVILQPYHIFKQCKFFYLHSKLLNGFQNPPSIDTNN
jgi:hypothetical protein